MDKKSIAYRIGLFAGVSTLSVYSWAMGFRTGYMYEARFDKLMDRLFGTTEYSRKAENSKDAMFRGALKDYVKTGSDGLDRLDEQEQEYSETLAEYRAKIMKLENPVLRAKLLASLDSVEKPEDV